VLLTGPFGGLTDDVREFLLCLADEGLPLTGTTPALLAAAMSGPEPPAALAAASAN
jgi:hypothetical protein